MTGSPSPGEDAFVLLFADVAEVEQTAMKGPHRCPLVVPRPAALDVAGVRVVLDFHGSGERALHVGLVSPFTRLGQPLVVLFSFLARNGGERRIR